MPLKCRIPKKQSLLLPWLHTGWVAAQFAVMLCSLQHGAAAAMSSFLPSITDLWALSMETWSKVPQGSCVQRRNLLGLSGVDLQPQNSCG